MTHLHLPTALAIEQGYMTMSLEELPITLGGDGIEHCWMCNAEERVHPSKWRIVTSRGYVCARCTKTRDPLLAPVQAHCDIVNAIDDLLRRFDDREDRGVQVRLIDRTLEHFANWRWPDQDYIALDD